MEQINKLVLKSHIRPPPVYDLFSSKLGFIVPSLLSGLSSVERNASVFKDYFALSEDITCYSDVKLNKLYQ